MLGFRTLLLLALLLLLSFLSFACTLEPLCDDGDSECVILGNGYQDYRSCIRGEWVDGLRCLESKVCLHGACVSPSDCGEKLAQCSSSGEVEICALSGSPMLVSCKDGLSCDDEACAKGLNCCVMVEVCEVTQNSCLDEATLKICIAGSKASKLSCGEGEKCEAGACVDDKTINECDEAYAISCDANVALTCVEHMILRTDCGDMNWKDGVCVEDLCNNNRLDGGEAAVDCGASCLGCAECRVDSDCGINGFCDSAFGYLCSKRCRGNDDCANSSLWDGEFCRGDGRCSPKVFETTWDVGADNLSLVLPFEPDDLKG